jgi:methylmalonyl-CoA mutase N-terminal domain/subunit
VVDPLAGSYYIESLTDEIERRTWEWMVRVDEHGGAIRGVETGWLEQTVSDTAHQQQLQIMNNERTIVGVNDFKGTQGERPIETFRVDEKSEEEQIRRLEKVRAERNHSAVGRTLDTLQGVVADGGNVMEAVIAASKAHATQGEIVKRVIAEVGEYIAPPIY